ncbi:unnamed protein product [Pleuronectes platessa]|uniref:Uncharacterized protein n=1 Tax=Pleuronectes platessa TaxID=8262 RepID=A0A9N7UK76_PLEPL|nr:unnamed protein product [Pleuronectes platessa]
MFLTLGVATTPQDGCREDCISQKALLGEVPKPQPSLKLELRCGSERRAQRSGDKHEAAGRRRGRKYFGKDPRERQVYGGYINRFMNFYVLLPGRLLFTK